MKFRRIVQAAALTAMSAVASVPLVVMSTAPAEAAYHDICMVNATSHNLYVNGHKVKVGKSRCGLTRKATVRSNSQRFRFAAMFGHVGTGCLAEDKTYKIGNRVDLGADHILYAQRCN